MMAIDVTASIGMWQLLFQFTVIEIRCTLCVHHWHHYSAIWWTIDEIISLKWSHWLAWNLKCHTQDSLAVVTSHIIRLTSMRNRCHFPPKSTELCWNRHNCYPLIQSEAMYLPTYLSMIQFDAPAPPPYQPTYLHACMHIFAGCFWCTATDTRFSNRNETRQVTFPWWDQDLNPCVCGTLYPTGWMPIHQAT